MENNRTLQQAFLNKYVFHGLKNLNDGYDAPSISYFSEEDFALVLQRAERLQLGIHGIEPWLNGEYYDVQVTDTPFDSSWYYGCFEAYKKLNLPLHYAASYEVPQQMLEAFEKEMKKKQA